MLGMSLLIIRAFAQNEIILNGQINVFYLWFYIRTSVDKLVVISISYFKNMMKREWGDVRYLQ